MVEIYCEKMFDLLNSSQRALDKGKGLPASLGGRGLSNAASIAIKSHDHVKKFALRHSPCFIRVVPIYGLTMRRNHARRELELAEARRAAAVLKGRSSSSRSHTVAVVNLWQKTNVQVLESSAVFVDLAGSEDMTQSGLSQQEVSDKPLPRSRFASTNLLTLLLLHPSKAADSLFCSIARVSHLILGFCWPRRFETAG